MKLSALTIGQRVALGFALLLLLGAALGGFATLKMLASARGAEFLSVAVAPQAEVTSVLAEKSALAQRAARTYGLTGDEEQLTATRRHLAEVETALENAHKLATAQPSLTALQTGINEAERALKNYVAAFDRTAANLAELGKIRAQLDKGAGSFMKSISGYISDQDKKLAKEIEAGLSAEILEPRRLKADLGNQILETGNAIRIANYKSQALRDPSIVEAVIPLFDTMEDLRKQLVATSVDEENLKQLAEVKTAAAEYKSDVQTLSKNFRDNATIGTTRAAAADEFDAIVGSVLERSIKRTLEYADESSTALSSASRLVIIGLVVMIVIGLVAALIIIRGVAKALTHTAENLSQGSLQVAAAAGQVSSSSQSLAEGSSEQAASLEEISSSIEELASMTRRNADNAQSGKTSAGHARSAAEAGAAEMERMQAAMNAIQQSSNDISKIIKTIDEIAFQTNILALNAAVEAARAGEAGAGFAVVADEVRSLAQRSALAAKETADKIVDATTRSAQGVELSARVSAGLKEIVEKSREVDRLVTEVATASNEQSAGIAQINTAVSQMDKVTQSNAASAEETASAAEELNAQSAELRNASAQLAALVGVQSMSHGTTPQKTIKPPKVSNTTKAHATLRLPKTAAASTRRPAPASSGETLSFHD
jgi:hypothetical protein